MNLALSIVLISLNAINVILHTLGTHLLLCIYQNGNDTTQMVYLINLAVCEALMNFLEGFRRVSELLSVGDNTMKLINTYVLVVMFTGISFVYYLDMVYITLDKMLDIILNIKFPLYWNVHRAKTLLIVTWMVGLLLSIIISLMYHFFGFFWEEIFFKYFYPIVGWAFILLAIITYSFIFFKFKSSTSTRRRSSTIEVFRKSRFYIPVWLILTFLIFMVVPDMTYLFIGIINGSETETLLAACWISYACSNLLDAFIYIYMQVNVRRLLLRKLKRFSVMNRIEPTNERGRLAVAVIELNTGAR